MTSATTSWLTLSHEVDDSNDDSNDSNMKPDGLVNDLNSIVTLVGYPLFTAHQELDAVVSFPIQSIGSMRSILLSMVPA